MARRKPKVRQRIGPRSNELADEDKGEMIALVTAFGSAHPANADMYDPRDSQRVPKQGAWVMIVRALPSIERGIDEHVRVGRVFWVEHTEGADDAGFLQDGTYKVRCPSPWGDVWLWPYEYSVVEPERLLDYWMRGDWVFHPTALSGKEASEIMFYARTRGLSLAAAAVMALGQLMGPVGWFEPKAGLAGQMEELAEDWKNLGWITKEGRPRKRTIQEPMYVEIMINNESVLQGQIP